MLFLVDRHSSLLVGICMECIKERYMPVLLSSISLFGKALFYTQFGMASDIFPITILYINGNDDWRKTMPSSSRKGTPPQPPTIPPKLIVPRSEAQQKLETHIEKGRELAKRLITSEADMEKADAEGDKWRDYAIRLLATLFESSSLADEYRDKTKRTFIVGSLEFTQERDFFKDRMNNWWIKELESILESLELMQESSIVNQHTSANNGVKEKDPQTEALEKIELIANRFHIIARQLRHRHNDRPTLIIENEYDVQDLFHALLRLFF